MGDSGVSGLGQSSVCLGQQPGKRGRGGSRTPWPDQEGRPQEAESEPWLRLRAWEPWKALSGEQQGQIHPQTEPHASLRRGCWGRGFQNWGRQRCAALDLHHQEHRSQPAMLLRHQPLPREGPGPPGQPARTCWSFTLVPGAGRWRDRKPLALSSPEEEVGSERGSGGLASHSRRACWDQPQRPGLHSGTGGCWGLVEGGTSRNPCLLCDMPSMGQRGHRRG